MPPEITPYLPLATIAASVGGTLIVERALPYWVKLGPKFWVIYPQVSALLKSIDSRMADKVGLVDDLVAEANEALADQALSPAEIRALMPKVEKIWSMLILSRKQRKGEI